MTSRAGFPYLLEIQTRWADNDVYGHVNNVVYYAYFDTIINRYLIEEGGLDVRLDHAIGVCVTSQCTYKQSISFPDSIHAGLRVSKLGKTSASYQIAIFHGEELCAEGSFVHVFVERATGKPTPIPPAIRGALERIAAPPG